MANTILAILIILVVAYVIVAIVSNKQTYDEYIEECKKEGVDPYDWKYQITILVMRYAQVASVFSKTQGRRQNSFYTTQGRILYARRKR